MYEKFLDGCLAICVGIFTDLPRHTLGGIRIQLSYWRGAEGRLGDIQDKIEVIQGDIRDTRAVKIPTHGGFIRVYTTGKGTRLSTAFLRSSILSDISDIKD